MANGNGGRRADLAHRIERRVSAALTEELFGDADDGYDGGLLEAAAAVVTSRGEDAAAVARLERAGWTSNQLTRVPAQTLMADIPGLASSPNAAAYGPIPAQIRDRIERRQRPTRRLLDALTVDLPMDEMPWILGPPAPPTAATEVAEFGEAGSRTITVGGGFVTPSHVSRTADISWQAARVQDEILALMGEDAYHGAGQWLVGKLVGTAGAAVADVKTAISQIETAGWFVDTLLAPLSRVDRISAAFGEAASDALEAANLIVAPVGARVLVVASPGVDTRVSREGTALIAQPSIGAFEISASYWATYTAHAGAVRQVTA